MALSRHLSQGTKCLVELALDPIRCFFAVLRYVLPDFEEVVERLRQTEYRSSTISAPRGLPCFQLGERLLRCQTIATLELGNPPLYLFVDRRFVLLKPAFLCIERFQSPMDDFLRATEYTSLQSLLNELFVFGFEIDRHRHTLRQP